MTDPFGDGPLPDPVEQLAVLRRVCRKTGVETSIVDSRDALIHKMLQAAPWSTYIYDFPELHCVRAALPSWAAINPWSTPAPPPPRPKSGTIVSPRAGGRPSRLLLEPRRYIDETPASPMQQMMMARCIALSEAMADGHRSSVDGTRMRPATPRAPNLAAGVVSHVAVAGSPRHPGSSPGPGSPRDHSSPRMLGGDAGRLMALEKHLGALRQARKGCVDTVRKSEGEVLKMREAVASRLKVRRPVSNRVMLWSNHNASAPHAMIASVGAEPSARGEPEAARGLGA